MARNRRTGGPVARTRATHDDDHQDNVSDLGNLSDSAVDDDSSLGGSSRRSPASSRGGRGNHERAQGDIDSTNLVGNDEVEELVVQLADKNSSTRIEATKRLLVILRDKLDLEGLEEHASQAWVLASRNSLKKAESGSEELKLVCELISVLLLCFQDTLDPSEVSSTSSVLMKRTGDPECVICSALILLVDANANENALISTMRRVESAITWNVPPLRSWVEDEIDNDQGEVLKNAEAVLASIRSWSALASRLSPDVLKILLFGKSEYDSAFIEEKNATGEDVVDQDEEQEETKGGKKSKPLSARAQAKLDAKKKKREIASQKENTTHFQSYAASALLYMAKGEPLSISCSGDVTSEIQVAALRGISLIVDKLRHKKRVYSDEERDEENGDGNEEEEDYDEDEYEDDEDDNGEYGDDDDGEFNVKPKLSTLKRNLDRLVDELGGSSGHRKRVGKKQRSGNKAVASAASQVAGGSDDESLTIELAASRQWVRLQSPVTQCQFEIFKQALGMHVLRIFLEVNPAVRHVFHLGEPRVQSSELVALAAQNKSGAKRSIAQNRKKATKKS
eukprot:CAMPEP_0184706374 /NCGR_PEP_ID=MMETSP0313-20130426/36726_1 /TAXON_ID=2792 /ORGANISM="Porphyridium aerugineum, Strain SAG 1380-2" /LENGTH=564 /DNA_ID=CAMNT_0027167927 /DNA_START=176 /DNA_END=1870 /DNA_ORIENTATION=+